MFLRGPAARVPHRFKKAIVLVTAFAQGGIDGVLHGFGEGQDAIRHERRRRVDVYTRPRDKSAHKSAISMLSFSG
jgi:hypothetical protein